MREIIAQDTEYEERILTFIESMDAGSTPFLRQLEQEALRAGIPIIRTQTQSLIQFLLEVRHPHRILEVGTATGFSALYMREFAGPDAQITTIELDEGRAMEARQHFAEAGADNIESLIGDAGTILPTLTGTYDLIFMDAAKGQYIHFLPEVKRLLAEGGILLSDNIFKEGEILESRFAVKRRNRTIHKRMREYLHALRTDSDLQTLLLQEGDGAALSVRKRH